MIQDKRLIFRLDSEMLMLIDDAAKNAGINRSEFIKRSCMVACARQIAIASKVIKEQLTERLGQLERAQRMSDSVDKQTGRGEFVNLAERRKELETVG